LYRRGGRLTFENGGPRPGGQFSGVYKKLLFTKDGTVLLGGMMVGDTADYAKLLNLCNAGTPLISPPDELVTGKSAAGGGGASRGP
jgi:NAD(P)H-nitrite reductase large subunit